MESQTAVILALQLVVLGSIACSLLLYLLCRIRGRPQSTTPEGHGRGVLITSCDTTWGLHCALRLSELGFRVFAGVKDEKGDAAKIIRAKMKEHEGAVLEAGEGGWAITLVTLDVTREDLLHEAVDDIRRHLPAGDDGLWAVINTAGMFCRGRLDQQQSTHWDALLRLNVVGTLKTARTFTPLLKNKRGRFILIGANTGLKASKNGSGMIASTAARFAVEGISSTLRFELAAQGIDVITLHPEGVAEKLFSTPKVQVNETVLETEKSDDETILNIEQLQLNKYLKYNTNILPEYVTKVLEEAVLSPIPHGSYQLSPNSGMSFFKHRMHHFNKNSNVEIVS